MLLRLRWLVLCGYLWCGSYRHLIGAANTVDALRFEKPIPGPVHNLQIEAGGVHCPKRRRQAASHIDGAESWPVRDLRILPYRLLIDRGLLDRIGICDAAGYKTACPVRPSISAQKDAGKAVMRTSALSASSLARERPFPVQPQERWAAISSSRSPTTAICRRRSSPVASSAATKCRSILDGIFLHLRCGWNEKAAAAGLLQFKVKLLHQFGIGRIALQPCHALRMASVQNLRCSAQRGSPSGWCRSKPCCRSMA